MVLIISSLNSENIYAKKSDNNLQFQLGDQISIYSEKAYRKNNGAYFEAVGNVVIKSVEETLYGEKATFDLASGMVIIEGNVRFVNKLVTMYGSYIEFNTKSEHLIMQNARIVTQEFNLTAKNLERISGKKYKAREAEFTTCKDCVESWSIYGDELEIELEQYVRIYHANLKIKGINMIYIPFIILPIKNKRETGLLFPIVSSRFNEGIAIEQPVYFALADNKDLTLTPSFYARRGYGASLQYRHEFGEERWLELNQKGVDDRIYLPGRSELSTSGERYFRNFTYYQQHHAFSNNLAFDLRYTGLKDLDFVRDFGQYTDNYTRDSDVGAEGFLEQRSEHFLMGTDFMYKRNMLFSDPEFFDQSYVQILPSVYFSTRPMALFQADRNYFYNLYLGLDGDYTIFRTMDGDEGSYYRNVHRVNANPYAMISWLNVGPIQASTEVKFSYQGYDFQDDSKENFYKYATLYKTEFSFTMDKIFGLAYQQNIPVDKIQSNNTERDSLDKQSDQKKTSQGSLIGKLPPFDTSLTSDTVTVVKNSYRHSQEFKFVHHYIGSSRESGNEKFEQDIESNIAWFDYQDAILRNLSASGVNTTRTSIPLKNTIEFQWNNTLIRKSPSVFDYQDDRRFLRDNFSYKKVGFFNLSQGLDISKDEGESLKDQLTRLYLHTGYSVNRWGIDLKDYYFHQSANHIMNLTLNKRFDKSNYVVGYVQNDFESQGLKTIKTGAQFLPVETLGLSYIQEYDLENSDNIRTIYHVDIMPNNNCWIFNLNYTDSVVAKRYAFNFVFNFGGEKFTEYKKNFFDIGRID